MVIRKKALIYDISNMAYVIADTGDDGNHSLHRVRDICEAGNIDRVSRVLGIAYAKILALLSPLIETNCRDEAKDESAKVHDYPISFRDDGELKYSLSPEKKLKIKELTHEFMVCMVLTDWLEVTFPVAADVWKDRMERVFGNLKDVVMSVCNSFSTGFRRKLSPF